MANNVQPEIDWALVYAILAGEADEIQEAKWRELFLSSEEYRDLYAELKPKFEEAEQTNAVSRLERLNKLHLPQQIPFRISPKWSVAATIMLLISLAGVFTLRRSPTRQPITWQYIKAVPGASTTITFPEGSSVRLAPQSSIRFPNTFEQGKREVFLSGEGYFNISKDSSAPFYIHTSQITTKVLGTSFRVMEDGAKNISVTLVEGKVQIIRNGAEQTLATLQPCQSFIFDQQDKNWEIKKISSKEAELLRNGGIVFNATPMKEVGRLLGIYFDKKVIFENITLETLRFTSMFDKPSLPDILQAIKSANKIDYIIRDNTLFFKKKF
jgi:ferric-dicitrate binding protein FerR (iron transport regulator)